MTRAIIPKATHMAIVNGGDGSAYALLFSSREGAERYMEELAERFCDDIINIERGIELDPEHHEWATFGEAVMDFIMPAGPYYREDRILALAEHFECAQVSVHYWADGIVVPPRGLREQVIDYISRHHERTTERAEAL